MNQLWRYDEGVTDYESVVIETWQTTAYVKQVTFLNWCVTIKENK